MTKNHFWRRVKEASGPVGLLVSAVALGLVLTLMVIIGLEPAPGEVMIPYSYSCAVYTEQGCAKYVVASGGEIEVQSGGTLDAQSGSTVNVDTLTLANDETIGNSTDGLIDFNGGLILHSTTITVTDGQTITPTTYTGYRLNAAGAATITLAACSSDFQPLALYGEDNQTITISDSNVRTNDGNAQTLGQYDAILWMCINSEWVEISESNNS